MKTQLLKMARRTWANPHAPRRTVRHNQLAYARAIYRLGDKWLLAKKIERKADE